MPAGLRLLTRFLPSVFDAVAHDPPNIHKGLTQAWQAAWPPFNTLANTLARDRAQNRVAVLPIVPPGSENAFCPGTGQMTVRPSLPTPGQALPSPYSEHRKYRYIHRNFAVSKDRGRAPRRIDENRSLPYKPRQLSAMTRPDRGGSFGPETACFGPASINGLISFLGKLFLGKLPGQRRTAREADLSTQQTGAQAPSRLPRPPRDHRWPQGSRRAARAGPQAFERLSRASRRPYHGSA